LAKLHRATGTEFSRVLLFGIDQGAIPRTFRDEQYAEDAWADALLRERSLLYVPATRARDEPGVCLYCSSGAALLFAWRDYMPTFTDTSLIAAGAGTLLWTLLATEASPRRRTWAGIAGFAAIEIATFVRYTERSRRHRCTYIQRGGSSRAPSYRAWSAVRSVVGYRLPEVGLLGFP
jgi:hypothetical protein